MNCPKCESQQIIVTDSRPKNSMIYRRRKCLDCGYSFSTYEISKDEYKSSKRAENLLAQVQKKLEEITGIIEERKANES